MIELYQKQEQKQKQIKAEACVVIRCMTRRARVRGSPCIVRTVVNVRTIIVNARTIIVNVRTIVRTIVNVRTIVKRPWGSQRDTKHVQTVSHHATV